MFDGRALRERQREAFRADVLAGLSRPQKALPSRWLYDERGSDLFEAITELDEYYLTRTEIAILGDCGERIAEFCGDGDVLLEYGPGAGVKSELLIGALSSLRVYIPVDIASDFLEETAGRLGRAFPLLQTSPLVADFTDGFALPNGIPEGHRLGFFPGSTIGNLDVAQSTALLRRLRSQVGTGGRAIVGADLKKSPEILTSAYADAAGVTARFNANILARINRELGGDFVSDQFRHSARWNAAESAIEMHLESLKAQTATVAGRGFAFKAGETIHTESSRKYDVAGFRELAARSGWRVARTWTDERAYFAVFGLTPSA